VNWYFFLILIGSLLECCGDLYFKKWAEERGEFILQNHSLLLFGLFLYLIGSLAWVTSLKFGTLSRSIALFSVVNALVGVAFGVILFGEELSLRSWAAIALGAMSIILLEIE
jgi:hypothetical protein